MREPLHARRHLPEHRVLPVLDEPIRYSQELPTSYPDLIQAVKTHAFDVGDR